MPSFDDTGKRLHAAQREKENARLALFRARERRERIGAAAARLERYFEAGNPEHEARRQDLALRTTEIEAEIKERSSALVSTSARVDGLVADLRPFTDPREHIGAKKTDFPFLLFPLRLETRFKTVETGGGPAKAQMWVRAYPDEGLVDSFEATPSEGEILVARKFWVDWVKAGGEPSQRRGAWAALVSRSGAGRSAWLIEQYRPVSSLIFPSKDAPHDVILVVATEEPLPDAEKPRVATFWKAYWLADDDGVRQQAAYAGLREKVGTERAAVILADFAPENLEETPAPPRTRSEVKVEVAFLELPQSATVDTQRQPWSQAPRVTVLPERLVLVGYRDGNKVLEQIGNAIPSPLVTGPDPSADPADQMHQDGDEVVVGEEMKWIVDFDEAVRVGMAFRVDLSADDLRLGFDQLIVVGVRLGANEADGKDLLETLLRHHETGNSGLSLLPQGTPTNNTEAAGSGFSESEDADESYALVFGDADPLVREERWLPRTDGQWLAEMLGIDLATFEKTPHSRGWDQCEARAMNAALWPATWGYLMESMMGPLFAPETIERTRFFFNHFVLARGTVPALRIGEQPYGILPTTAFSRMTWLKDKGFRQPRFDSEPEANRAFLIELQKLLAAMRADWKGMSERVSHVGKAGDPHQILLDVLGLHATSAEYHQRYAESLEQFTNRMKLQGFWEPLLVALIALGYTQSGMDLLAKLGYEGDEMPEVLEKFFLKQANKLLGEVIDDQKLSEVNPIRAYTDDGRNYLRWLIDAARTSFDTLRKEEGFSEDRKPRALLYLMLRYALEQGYWDASLRLYEEFEVLSPSARATARLDPSFVHVAEAETAGVASAEASLPTSGKPVRLEQRSESRYEYLYQTAPAITDSPDVTVAEFIPGVMETSLGTRHLYQQLEALEHLVDTPTARLERLLAEHVDVCTYRLDAWRAGLLGYQLAGMRYGREGAEGGPGVTQGLYLGAFGWLEKVRSENKLLSPVELDEELDGVFNPEYWPDLSPLLRDSKNGGYIHAPSLNHAIAAAILRNGYLANASRANPETLKVNLSSERVRAALGVIEGIRNGQKLGALLGYQLERGLHDRHSETEVDRFIFELRKAFPLVADKRRDTKSEPEDAIQTVEARNVVDGFELVNHVKKTGEEKYPFGKSLAPASPAQAEMIDSEVDRLRDIHDALADLVLAEGVFQTVQGNFGRVASTLEAYAKGTFPPEPEVVQTPRSGVNLAHRMGLHFEPGLSSTASPNGMAVTPRAFAEPAVNKWLNDILPDPSLVFCRVSYFDPSILGTTTVDVTQEDLGLQPLDLLFLVSPQAEQAMAELDDRIVHHVLTAFSPRWDEDIAIEYTARATGRYAFFEVGALVAPLRSLILGSRPLNAADVALPSETIPQVSETSEIDPARLSTPLSDLGAIVQSPGPSDDLETLLADMATLLAGMTAHRNDTLDAVDGWLTRTMELLSSASRFGVSGAGIGFAYDWKKVQLAALRKAVAELVDRRQASLDAFDDVIGNELPAATTEKERLVLLARAERHVSTESTLPVPATSAAYLSAVQAKRAAFASKLAQLRALSTSSGSNLSTLLHDLRAELPLSEIETQSLDLTKTEDEVLRFAEDLARRGDLLRNEINRRKSTAEDHMSAAAASGSAAERVQFLTEVAKTLFGEHFKIVPEFRLSSEQASEWQKAWNDSAVVLTYLTDPEPSGLDLDFPVDEWLYGVARVREAAGRWERVMMLTGALGGTVPELLPIQLPYRSDDRWLALPYPPGFKLEGERLLYTAHYAVPFDKAASECGLLLDEWTEVIPADEETTGIAFHYDRPSSEPPQTMLLVTSPQMRGGWQWEDLLDAIRETFDEARLRAVEPAQVDDTAYARFLPATISAVTVHPITIMLNLALNNNVYQQMGTDDA